MDEKEDGTRSPTFKDYGDQIKQLKQENFQLKLRIYLNEQKYGKFSNNTNMNDSFSSIEGDEIFSKIKDMQTISEENLQLKEKMQDFDLKFSIAENYKKTLLDKIKKLEDENEILIKEKENFNLEIAFGPNDFEYDSCPFSPIPSSTTFFGQGQDNNNKMVEKNIQTERNYDDYDEIIRLKSGKKRLTEENNKLFSQIQTLQAQLNTLQDKFTTNDLYAHNRSETLESDLKKAKVIIRGMDRKIAEQKKKILTLEADKGKLLEKLHISQAALEKFHTDHAKLVGDLRTLKKACPINEDIVYKKKLFLKEKGNDKEFLSMRSQDSSPDLGIDVQSDENNENSIIRENLTLKKENRNLALKLLEVKKSLENTEGKLNNTQAKKDQVEKAICRQLHKTHNILKQVKVTLEGPPNPLHLKINSNSSHPHHPHPHPHAQKHLIKRGQIDGLF